MADGRAFDEQKWLSCCEKLSDYRNIIMFIYHQLQNADLNFLRRSVACFWGRIFEEVAHILIMTKGFLLPSLSKRFTFHRLCPLALAKEENHLSSSAQDAHKSTQVSFSIQLASKKHRANACQIRMRRMCSSFGRIMYMNSLSPILICIMEPLWHLQQYITFSVPGKRIVTKSKSEPLWDFICVRSFTKNRLGSYFLLDPGWTLQAFQERDMRSLEWSHGKVVNIRWMKRKKWEICSDFSYLILMDLISLCLVYDTL